MDRGSLLAGWLKQNRLTSMTRRKNINFHLEIDVGLHVRLEYRKTYESVLGGEGHRMMNRMVSLPEFAGNPDNGRDTLMWSLMASSTARNLQVWISVEPDLLQLAHEMRYVLARVKISAYMESAKFQDALLSQLRFRCICKQTINSSLN